MSINPDIRTYRSSDLALCAALIARGHKLVGLDATTPRRINFLIQANSTLNSDVSNYYGDSMLVNARSYFDAIKLLKSRLYGG